MIESNFSCSSLWESEPLENLDTELPLSEIDDYIPSLELNCTDLESSIALNKFSCSSSEQDSGLIFKELDFLSYPVNDSFISQILEDSNSIDNWSWLEDEIHNLPHENGLSSPRDSPKKRRKNSKFLKNKPWSKMSPEEQIKTLHALSEIVTCRMGIREQIEVIKIIDPSVTISPDDKEFALDISCLNDSKMKRIRDYVQKVGFSLSSSSKQLNSSSNNDFESEKPSAAYKMLSRKTNSRTKRRQKKQKQCTNEDTRKKRKLELHGQKEVRSGLFVYEKVIKKLSNPLEEDEDVNILE